MTPTFAVESGVRYRYYISTPLLHGKSDAAGTVNRVPASDVEDTIVKRYESDWTRGRSHSASDRRRTRRDLEHRRIEPQVEANPLTVCSAWSQVHSS